MPKRSKDIPKKLPLFSIEDKVLFPGRAMQVSVPPGSKNFELLRSRILSSSTDTKLIIGVIPVSLGNTLNGEFDWHIGTAAVVDSVTTHGWPNPTVSFVMTGLNRIHVEKLIMEDPYPVGVLNETLTKMEAHWDENDPEFTTLSINCRESMLKVLNMASEIGNPQFINVKKLVATHPAHLLPDICPSFVVTSFAEKLKILSTFDVIERFKVVSPLIQRQIRALEFFQKTNQSSLMLRLTPNNRNSINYGIRRILDSANSPSQNASSNDLTLPDVDEPDSLQELYNKLKDANLPPQAWKAALKEFQKFKRMSSINPEQNTVRSYLELMSELPWSKSSTETLNINKARIDMEADHYAMDKLKKRVLEYLAVRQLKNNLRGPILCFVGPPGVGKTSIGRSIAHTLGREFHRISLGGINQTSDIRGHRRTYIGAMPGRIIQGLKSVGVNNPVFLLDEVDKLKAGYQGDPAAALLEVLDPEQNHTFHDLFLNIPFDLSQVMFIATANSIKTIPHALLDRMEVIEVDGYTQDEKLHIALRHLIPKQLEQHGLDSETVQIPAITINALISGYTYESGVRSLERKIAALCRDIAVKVAEQRMTETVSGSFIIDNIMLEDILGPAPFSNAELWSRLGQPGVAVGLAATTVGGEVLLVEASKMDGEGQLLLTGQLGDVMKESAKLALTWLRTAAYRYRLTLDNDILSHTDVHIHFPAGAISKDGPSAGITIITVLLSLFSERSVSTDVAMTGEISLKGAVLPVGGIKAKVLAAHRFGIKRVILPELNAKDLLKLPEEVRDEVEFILVSHIDEVIQAAFEGGFPMIGTPDDINPLASSKL